MNKLKNNDRKLKDSLIIEDFKRACKRIENHETRSFRIYLLIIAGFAVILGSEQRIEDYFIPFIPFMLNIFLFIAFNFIVTDRRSKYFAMSYLQNSYYNDIDEINYENYFRDFMFLGDNNEPTKYIWWKIKQLIFHPLLVIYVFGFIISTMFARDLVTETYQNKEWICFLPYTSTLIFLQILIIKKLCVLYKNDFYTIKKRVEDIHKKEL